ncbi:L-type lectin-domain containing protein [Pseudanabaena sp. FACHB-2040]|uniref:L-type lectin-domain containing protein n=1 Tax=Pseudanabaena sp. FACHB-2040 TaxID=2692859 RepID=UPI0016892014|nr:L-type lectin-domain containing protein [Pseudanabaena sp. FACHB-2040]MBD2258477.1 hypothetical protein [Pseudanabaena sp. FACHB-2040]
MSTLTLEALLGPNSTRNGTAEAVNGVLQLTPDAPLQAGSAFYNIPVSVTQSFQSAFRFQIDGTSATTGADGLTFLLQSSPLGPSALGDDGGNLGYLADSVPLITPAVVVEFDTFFNPENNDNPNLLTTSANLSEYNAVELISYSAGGAGQILEQIKPDVVFNTGDVYTAWIDYTASETGPGVLQISTALGASKPAQPLVSQEIDLSSVLGSQAFLGFTAGSGNAFNSHDILSWGFARQGAVGTGYLNFRQFTEAAALELGVDIPYQDLEVNGLFTSLFYDETYYLCRNPDIAVAVANGFFTSGYEHFLTFGLLEGRSPSILFRETYYLNQNPDVAQAKVDGVVVSGFQHYIQFGQVEGRDPSALFNERAYLAANGDVQAAVGEGLFTSGFDHYIEFGASEGRGPSLILFNENYYLTQYSDVASALASDVITSGFQHYILFGQGEQRNPSGIFDEAAYLAANSDVAGAVSAGAFSSGFQHYILSGRCEGRAAIPVAA